MMLDSREVHSDDLGRAHANDDCVPCAWCGHWLCQHPDDGTSTECNALRCDCPRFVTDADLLYGQHPDLLTT